MLIIYNNHEIIKETETKHQSAIVVQDERPLGKFDRWDTWIFKTF